MNAVFTGLLALSIVVIELLIGGTRLVFSLPSYGLVAVAAILSIGVLRRDSARPHLPCLMVTVLFTAYMLARAATSPWDYLWWPDFYQLLASLTVYLLVALCLTAPVHRLWIIGVLLALATVEFFNGLRQFRGMDEWMMLPFITRGMSGARASGTLISSIHFAGLLEAIGPFALAVAFWSRWAGWARWLAGYAALLCYGGVAISGSRGAYLSSLFSLGVFIVISFVAVKRTRPERLMTVITGTGIFAVAAFAGAVLLMSQSPMIRARFDLLTKQDFRIVDYATASKEGKPMPGMDIRVKLWQAALDQFHLSPLLGTGAGTYLYYGRLFRSPQVQGDPVHAHSDYLEILAEYGIIGAAGMLLFIVFHLRAGLRRFFFILRSELGDLDDYQPARSNELALVAGALCAVAAYLAHSAIDFNLHIQGHSMFFGFIFGILASPRGDDRPESPRTEMAFRFLLPALGIWLAVAGMGKFTAEFWCEYARQALTHGKYSEAIEHATRALQREQRNPDLFFHYGEAHRGKALQARDPLARKQLLLTALDAYNHSLAIFPLDEHVLIRKAQALDGLARFTEAGEIYRKAIEHDPNLGVLHGYYAQHLFRVGRQDEAMEEVQAAGRLAGQAAKTIVDNAFLDAPTEPSRPDVQKQ